MSKERYVYQVIRKETGEAQCGYKRQMDLFDTKPTNARIAQIVGNYYFQDNDYNKVSNKVRDSIIAEQYEVKKYKLVEVKED